MRYSIKNFYFYPRYYGMSKKTISSYYLFKDIRQGNTWGSERQIFLIVTAHF